MVEYLFHRVSLTVLHGSATSLLTGAVHTTNSSMESDNEDNTNRHTEGSADSHKPRSINTPHMITNAQILLNGIVMTQTNTQHPVLMVETDRFPGQQTSWQLLLKEYHQLYHEMQSQLTAQDQNQHSNT